MLWLLIFTACSQGQTTVDRALQRMYDQPRADPYEASTAFPNGAVMQAAPAGAIAREDSGDTVGAPASAASLARGRSRFLIFCAACHGAGGFGGSIVAENWLPPRPPSLREGAASELPADMVYRVASAGFGRMPGYASELSAADRWAVVAYVISLRHRTPADSAERSDSARAAALRAADSAGPGWAR